MVVQGRDTRQERVRLRDLAELALARGVRVLQHATGETDAVFKVLRAGLAAGRVDDGVFDRGAFGGRVGHGCGQEAVDCKNNISTSRYV